jgi:MFS family permease
LPNFRLLFIGRTVSTLSDALVPAALSIAVVQATGSATALAIVLACALVPRVVLMPLGGVLADRLHPRRVAIAADLVRVLTQAFVGVELLGDHPRLWHLAVAQAVAGAASACALPTTSPLTAGTVEGPARQRANALMGVSRSAAFLLGPALAGLLIFTLGAGWVFLLDSAAFATSAMLLTLISVTRIPVPHTTLRADLVEGWAEVRSRNWYWISLIAHAIWNFSSGVLLTLGPVIAIQRLGGEGVWVAVLQAGGIGLLLGSMLAGRATRLRHPVLLANMSLATYAIPLALFAIPAPAPYVVAGYSIALTALGFLNPVWETVVQQAVPQRVLARVTAYDWLVSLAAQPLGFTLAPLTAALWSPAVPLLGSAILVFVACLGTAAVPEVRRLAVARQPTTKEEEDDRGRQTPAGGGVRAQRGARQ